MSELTNTLKAESEAVWGKNKSLGSFQRKEDLYTPASRVLCESEELHRLTTKKVFCHRVAQQ